MKQIVDKLNKIAKKIDESVEIPQTDLIIDSLDAITKAYGGTPNDSNLIVDKLEDIYNNIEPAVSGNIEITENGENINVAPYATATVNVAGGGGENVHHCTITLVPMGENQEKQIQVDTGSVIIDNGSLKNFEDTITENTEVDSPHWTYTGKAEYTLIPFYFKNTVITATDAVNCEWNSNDACIYVTDPTVNSSITISGTVPK